MEEAQERDNTFILPLLTKNTVLEITSMKFLACNTTHPYGCTILSKKPNKPKHQNKKNPTQSFLLPPCQHVGSIISYFL